MSPLGWRGMEVILLLCAGRMATHRWIKQHPSTQGVQFAQLQLHFICVYTHNVSIASSCPQLVHRTELPIFWFLMSRLRVRSVVSLTMVEKIKSTARSLQRDDKPLNLVPSPICSLPWAQQPARLGDLRQKFCFRLFPLSSLVAGQGKEVGSPPAPMPSIQGSDSTARGSGEE